MRRNVRRSPRAAAQKSRAVMLSVVIDGRLDAARTQQVATLADRLGLAGIWLRYPWWPLSGSRRWGPASPASSPRWRPACGSRSDLSWTPARLTWPERTAPGLTASLRRPGLQQPVSSSRISGSRLSSSRISGWRDPAGPANRPRRPAVCGRAVARPDRAADQACSAQLALPAGDGDGGGPAAAVFVPCAPGRDLAGEVSAAAATAGGRPVLAEVTVSVGRTAAEARARADADELFTLAGHPAEQGLFGTLEECQATAARLAQAGATELVCYLPLASDLPDVLAQLRSIAIGAGVLRPGEPPSAAPPPPAWLGRPPAHGLTGPHSTRDPHAAPAPQERAERCGFGAGLPHLALRTLNLVHNPHSCAPPTRELAMPYETRFGSLDSYEKGGSRDHRRRPEALRLLQHLRGRVAGQAVREGRRREEHGVRPRGGPGRGDVRLADGGARRDRACAGRRGRGSPRDAPTGRRCRDKRARVGVADGEPCRPRWAASTARRGHMALLPAGRAYRFAATGPAVLLIQTIARRRHRRALGRDLPDGLTTANTRTRRNTDDSHRSAARSEASEPNEFGYRTFTLGGSTFRRDEYFAYVNWPTGRHVMSVDAFLRALQRDVAWDFFYGTVNFDGVVGTVNHYGTVDLFAGRYNDAYRKAELDHVENFETPVHPRRRSRRCSTTGRTRGSTRSPARRRPASRSASSRGTTPPPSPAAGSPPQRMVGVPGDEQIRTDANGHPINRMFADVAQDEPEVARRARLRGRGRRRSTCSPTCPAPR